MKKSDLTQIADLIDDRLDQRLGKLEQNLEKKFESIEQRFDQMDVKFSQRFDQVDARFAETDQNIENMEERIMISVKTEIDRLDSRIDEVVIELKKKPDRYEVFEWTDKRLAQLKFN